MPSHDDETTTVELTPDERLVVERIARGYAAAAPTGWLRIVNRTECSVAPGDAGRATVRVVVVQGPDGLVQETYRPPDDLYFVVGDLLDQLAGRSPSQSVTFLLVVDRVGGFTVTVTQDAPKLLVGIRDESSSRPVHDYLERNRAELEDLARRLG